MHTGTLRKLALALTLWLALHASSLKAQIFTNDLPLQAVTTGSNPVDFEFRSDGTLIAKGNYGVGSLGSGDQGNGTRMLWFPSLSAFRAGTINTDLTLGYNYWDASNIGEYSVAFGYNTTASGIYSAAFGNNTGATGTGSIASGQYSYAPGNYAVSLGYQNYASGQSSVAMGSFSIASGLGSIAMGNCTASGFASSALGYSNTASGNYSLALGSYSTASGYYATAVGNFAAASALFSTAFGFHTTASAYSDFVIGEFNVGGGSNTWVPTEPLFEIGNGSGSGYGNPYITGPSDAFVVYKNGSATFQGPVTVAPGGDIPMYAGN
jgi:Head domain of trimeric autotransporter adhesin